jgi:hypothetical protein
MTGRAIQGNIQFVGGSIGKAKWFVGLEQHLVTTERYGSRLTSSSPPSPSFLPILFFLDKCEPTIIAFLLGQAYRGIFSSWVMYCPSRVWPPLREVIVIAIKKKLYRPAMQ